MSTFNLGNATLRDLHLRHDGDWKPGAPSPPGMAIGGCKAR